MAGTKEQLLDEMRQGIGGSECHHLFDLDPYGCRRQLWYKKTSAKPDFPFYETNDTRRGTHLEQYVIEIYQEETKRWVATSECRRDEGLPEWLCHPDGIIGGAMGDPMEDWGLGILEVKCPGIQNFTKIKREGISEAWIMQMQHMLGVTGFRWGSYAIFSAEQWSLMTFDVCRDEAIIAKIKTEVERFWRLVENGPAPDRLLPTDNRCRSCQFRTQCQGDALLQVLAEDQQRYREDEQLPVDASLKPLITDLAEARLILKEAKDLEQAASQRLGQALGNRTAVQADDGCRAYYRAHETNRLDEAGIRKDHPEIAEKYNKRTVVRPLKVITTEKPR